MLALLPTLTLFLLAQTATPVVQASAPRTQSAAPPVQAQDAFLQEGLQSASRGLAWLALQQQADGSFRADVGYKLEDGYRSWNDNAKHLGGTAIVGMAFLAGGHTPDRGPYGKVVSRALDFVLSHSREDGYLTNNETRMYSHAFATLFLAEACGMVERPDLRATLQRAVNLIVSSQNKEGGWRYQPHVDDADMSVAACQVMALRAARNIGLSVPAATIDRAIQYVHDSAVRESDPPASRRWSTPGAFRYQPDWRSRSSWALTAAGMAVLHHSGVYADRDGDKALNYLSRDADTFNLDWGTRVGGHYSFYYGHYYAVQAFHMTGGQRYRSYMHGITRTLLNMQDEQGAWPNRVGPGTIFGTAMACLILQIPKEYLPIFQK